MKIISYLFSHSRIVKYSTNLLIPRVVMLSQLQIVPCLVSANFEYVVNDGHTWISILLTINSIIPPLCFLALAWKQKNKITE